MPSGEIPAPSWLHLPTTTHAFSSCRSKRKSVAAFAPNSRPTSSVTTSNTDSGRVAVATATATRLSAARPSASAATCSRASAFASATATRFANSLIRSSSVSPNVLSPVTETTTAPQSDPDTVIGAATSDVTPSSFSLSARRGDMSGSSTPPRAGRPVNRTRSRGPRSSGTTVPTSAIGIPGSLHFPTISPSSAWRSTKRTRFAASAPSSRATSSVTTSKTASGRSAFATATATRLSAARPSASASSACS